MSNMWTFNRSQAWPPVHL